MNKKNDIMEYADDGLIEYIGCLEKELNLRREIENSFIKVIKFDAEKIKSLYDDKQKTEKALDKACELLYDGYGYEYPKDRFDIDYESMTKDQWKEWLLKDDNASN